MYFACFTIQLLAITKFHLPVETQTAPSLSLSANQLPRQVHEIFILLSPQVHL